MKKILGMLAVGLMLSGVVNTASGAVETRGVRSCGQWVAEQAGRNSTNRHQTWLIGFMTGLIIATEKDALKGTDNDSIYLWMDNYCRQNPLKEVDEGGVALFLELKKQKNIK